MRTPGRLLGTGLVAGGIASFAAVMALRTRIPDAGGAPPVVLGLGSLLMAGVGAVASAWPAYRATKLDPLVTLSN
jgi:ABC-type antimicrobial peptide transport system permease subunit